MVRVASYVIPKKGNEVFLMRRFQTGWMDGKYGLASGHMEEGESPITAAIRETKEEAGIDVKPEDLKFVLVMHRKPVHEGDAEYIDFFFTTEKWDGEPKLMEPEKCDEIGWFSLGALPENILPYEMEMFEAVKAGKTLVER